MVRTCRLRSFRAPLTTHTPRRPLEAGTLEVRCAGGHLQSGLDESLRPQGPWGSHFRGGWPARAHLGARGQPTRGAWPLCPPGLRGSEPSATPRPAFPGDGYPNGRLAAHSSVWSGPENSGAAPRSGCEPLRPLSFKSPPGPGNRGNAGEMQSRPAAQTRENPHPVHPTAGCAALGSPPATPRPSRAAQHR